MEESREVAATPLVDTHAHLTDERFAEDRDRVIVRAAAAGLVAIIDAGTDLASSRAALLAARASRERTIEGGPALPSLWTTAGYHPHEAKDAPEDYLEQLAELASDPLVVAIGEIGLDYHYDFSPREVQRRVFVEQLRLAARLRLPVIVHDREAHEDTLTALRAEAAGRCTGVLHCFSGSAESAREYLEMGFYLSFGGPVTFNNARKAIEVIEAMPLERLLLETDCPYLTPVPRRGERNEPANVSLVCAKIAEALGMTAAEVARATTANARRLFGL